MPEHRIDNKECTRRRRRQFRAILKCLNDENYLIWHSCACDCHFTRANVLFLSFFLSFSKIELERSASILKPRQATLHSVNDSNGKSIFMFRFQNRLQSHDSIRLVKMCNLWISNKIEMNKEQQQQQQQQFHSSIEFHFIIKFSNEPEYARFKLCTLLFDIQYSQRG